MVALVVSMSPLVVQVLCFCLYLLRSIHAIQRRVGGAYGGVIYFATLLICWADFVTATSEMPETSAERIISHTLRSTTTTTSGA